MSSSQIARCDWPEMLDIGFDSLFARGYNVATL